VRLQNKRVSEKSNMRIPLQRYKNRQKYNVSATLGRREKIFSCLCNHLGLQPDV
jgi:hypothetical protein